VLHPIAHQISSKVNSLILDLDLLAWDSRWLFSDERDNQFACFAYWVVDLDKIIHLKRVISQ